MPRRLLCAALMMIALPALAETARPLRLAELSAIFTPAALPRAMRC